MTLPGLWRCTRSTPDFYDLQAVAWHHSLKIIDRDRDCVYCCSVAAEGRSFTAAPQFDCSHWVGGGLKRLQHRRLLLWYVSFKTLFPECTRTIVVASAIVSVLWVCLCVTTSPRLPTSLPEACQECRRRGGGERTEVKKRHIKDGICRSRQFRVTWPTCWRHCQFPTAHRGCFSLLFISVTCMPGCGGS